MSEIRTSFNDDQDDTQLFNMWQELVLEHCPNPDRIGCLGLETLRTFVETPSALDLTDPKYIHITQCAECTRELRQLRALRDERLRLKDAQKDRLRAGRLQWITAIAALLIAVVVLSTVAWRNRAAKTSEQGQNLASVSAVVDLSTDGAPRGAGEESSVHKISLPRQLIRLRLVLPYYSPMGIYRVTVTQDRSSQKIKAEDSGHAVVQGSRTEVQVKLDLSHVAPGTYFLGTALEGDGAPYYYPLIVNE